MSVVLSLVVMDHKLEELPLRLDDSPYPLDPIPP